MLSAANYKVRYAFSQVGSMVCATPGARLTAQIHLQETFKTDGTALRYVRSPLRDVCNTDEAGLAQVKQAKNGTDTFSCSQMQDNPNK